MLPLISPLKKLEEFLCFNDLEQETNKDVENMKDLSGQAKSK